MLYKKIKSFFKRPTPENSILIIGFFFSIVFSAIIQQEFAKKHLEQNEFHLQKLEDDIKLAFNFYLHPLQGIASTFHYSRLDIKSSAFREASLSRNLYANFKGALGFGFIRKINQKDLPQYQAYQAIHNPAFKLKRINNQAVSRDHLFVIELIEPIEKNKNALGLVVSDEQYRYQAALDSMRSGKATVSQSVQLVQANKNEPGFLYYLPIYQTSKTPENELEREKNLVGWAYAPLLAKEIVQFILDQNPQSIHFRLNEVNDNGSRTLLFSNLSHNLKVSSIKTKAVSVAGQTWEIDAHFYPGVFIYYNYITTLVFIFLMALTFIFYNYIKSIKVELDHQNRLRASSEEAVQIATDELNYKTHFLQDVIDNLPALIGYWDKDLKNKLSNNLYSEYFNKKPSEIYGQHISDVLTQNVYEGNLVYIKKALQGEKTEFERDLVNKYGETKTVLARYIPDIENNEVQGFYVIVIDITQIKKLEQEKRENQAQLFAKSKLSSLGEMSSGIAHEINNPLSIISGRSQRLKKIVSQLKISDIERESMHSGLESIVVTTERIASIIKGLRAFSRDTENDPYALLDFSDVINETLKLSNERLKDFEIKVEVSKGHEPLNVFGNQTQLSQVIMNLLSNAIDAIAENEDKWIKINLESENNLAIIRVIDSGHGIHHETLSKIMNPFFTTKPTGKGVGIGLSISKNIIEKHQGSLDYEFFQGHTSFIIKIPLALAIKKTEIQSA